MKLLTQQHRDQLLRNGAVNAARSENGETEADFLSVVKLFTPDANCTWLLSELDPAGKYRTSALCAAAKRR